MKYYAVQDFMGGHEKPFRFIENAKKYRKQLAKDLDVEEDLIELHTLDDKYDEPWEIINFAD